MKRHCFTSYPLFALIGLILSPLAVAHASDLPTDGVPFCAPFDSEQWQREQAPPCRQAAGGSERRRTAHGAADLFYARTIAHIAPAVFDSVRTQRCARCTLDLPIRRTRMDMYLRDFALKRMLPANRRYIASMDRHPLSH